jgi:hypothetical protein
MDQPCASTPLYVGTSRLDNTIRHISGNLTGEIVLSRDGNARYSANVLNVQTSQPWKRFERERW